jgi:hypothetical protein
MRIEPNQSLIAGVDSRETSNAKPDPLKNVPDRLETAQGDRAEISLSSSLSIANELASDSLNLAEVKLNADRVSEIQQRVKSGFYNTDHALNRAVDGILELYSA